MARPSVDGLERELHGRMQVLRVDIESPSARVIAQRYGLRATPTYVLLDGNGREVWRKVGGSPDREAVLSHLARLEAR